MKYSATRFAVAALFVSAGAVSALGATGTGTTQLSVSVLPEASLTVDTATTSLTSAVTTFGNFTGATNFTYKIRTAQVGGSGSVKVQITSDFAPTGGPSVGSPATGDALSYSCTISAPGTACAGSVNASTTTQTSVGTFGANARSAKAGNSGSVSWSLPDDPQYNTGSYSATATFTLSVV